jgi:hypothetical protein
MEKNEKKRKSPASFINADKTLVSVEGLVNIPKIYFQISRFYGTPKDSLSTALKNKGFTFEAKANKKIDLRDLNSKIYFAELDLSNEINRRFDLRKALQNKDAGLIEKTQNKYGLAVFLNRESFTLEDFGQEVEGRFRKYAEKNPDKPEAIEEYKEQVSLEISAVKNTFDMLKEVGVAKISERGTMYLNDFNTFKKVQLSAVSNEQFSAVTPSVLKEALSIASQHKAISDATYGEKEKDTNEKADVQESKAKEEKVEENKEPTKKRASKKSAK